MIGDGFMQIKGCGEEEYDKTIGMLNGVYGRAFGLPPRLEARHPLLLGRGNMENMRIALEDGVPVSAFNFYETEILIEGIPFKAASVGCVGTDDGFRGRNYASLLMDDAEDKMKKDGVRLEIISGGRSLYTRKGASRAGRYFRFELPAGGEAPEGYTIVPYRPEMLESLARVHSAEATRFCRSLGEFRLLVDSSMMPWGGAETAILCLMRGAGMEAYIVIRAEKSRSIAQVREFAGNREAIAGSLQSICRLLGMETIRTVCAWNDPMLPALESRGWLCGPAEWMGTVKILDFEGFMNDLMPYFRQRVADETLDGMRFHESSAGYAYNMAGEEVVIGSVQELNGLVLGSPAKGAEYGAQGGAVRSFFERVFPLPFIWGDDMSVQ
jgi:GNAT superfamily N-acetyltransferase